MATAPAEILELKAKWQENEDIEGPRKTWIPLENNPEIFDQLIRTWGVSDKIGFHDVYSLDSPDLLAFIPRPCYALLATIPSEVYNIARKASTDLDIPVYQGSGEAEPVLWFRQTIGHACGTMGALHSVANGGAKAFILPGSDIERLLQAAAPLKPKERAQLLYDSPELEEAHKSVMTAGQSAAPSPEEENYNHFIAFVRGDDGHLWELEGGVDGPLDRGKLGDGDDALSQRALDLGIRPFIEKARNAGCDNVNFSCVALAPALV